MKGIIAICLKNMIKDNYSIEKWNEILELSDIDPYIIINAVQDFDDDIILKMVDSTCKVLNISLEQAADAFGEYWMKTFAPKIYEVYFREVESAKDFILKMNKVHSSVTSNIPNAKPPKFKYEWKDDRTLVIEYISHRNLIDIMIGLIRGVGKYFDEELKVRKLSDTKAEVVFP
ncbi:MAG: heme NO-binding domain-containing protein [Candidatus Cloacimonetes bacterium]|nr:heme NO-binding domain-containing protein [Candidatus Cloacimonadota bacterium]